MDVFNEISIKSKLVDRCCKIENVKSFHTPNCDVELTSRENALNVKTLISYRILLENADGIALI